MGAVYLAQDSQLGRQVALKMPFFGGSESPQRAERFVREARSAAALQHPNICTVFDAGQIDGRPFITMAYIAGTPLEEEIDPDAPMPQLRAAETVRKIALALEHAHGKGIVHRDLKPANVMMAAGGEPVVMDFGLAKRVADVDPNEAKLTRLGGLLGTPSYMSPEQVKGEGPAVGPATDVYALGVMLFEMLTGESPYTGALAVVIGRILTAPVPPVKEFRPDVDVRLDAICRKAMAKKPADRFPSMAEFADALGDYLKTPLIPRSQFLSWPLSQDYNEAIQSPASSFDDPDLRRGEAVANALGLPMPYSGNFADVYQVRCPDGRLGRQVLHPARGGAARALPGDQPPTSSGPSCPSPWTSAIWKRAFAWPGRGIPSSRCSGWRASRSTSSSASTSTSRPCWRPCCSCGPHGQVPARGGDRPLRPAARQRPAGAGRRRPTRWR